MKTFALIKDNQSLSYKSAETKPIISPNKGEFYEVNDPGEPDYSPETEICTASGRIYYGKWKIEYEVRDKTTEELNQMWAAKNTFDGAKARVLLQKVAEPLINVEDPTPRDIEAAKSVYQHWLIGVDYKVDEIVVYNDQLYQVLQSHSSQADWKPDAAVSLYVGIGTPGVIEVWEQRPAENPYMIGDRVYFPTAQDDIYESLIDNNTWSPSAYPAGWELV